VIYSVACVIDKFTKSIQCRIQNKTPVLAGRLLFNKIKNQKKWHGIIGYK